MQNGNPLSSAEWHRVAALRPSLHDQVHVTRTWVRGQRWHVLHDRQHQQSCRLNDAAYAVAARLDGRTTMDELWQRLDGAATMHASGEPPSQDDIMGVLARLQSQGMLALDTSADFKHSRANEPILAPPTTAKSLLAWRMPLGNPDAWLSQQAHWAHRLFSKTALALWLLSMLALLTGLLLHGPALRAHAETWMQTPRYLWLALLVYPLIKAVHELGHALAVKRWNGAVREVGLTWMMFMPVPYVNASAAHGFPQAWQRALVAAAGIQCELVLATIGLWIWHWSDSGMVQDAAFVVWFIACASTVLFNANPLQRLDGYHLMTEALHLPNLALRSQHAWQVRVQDWLRGQAGPDHQPHMAPSAPGEQLWLTLYAPLAWTYQLGLWTGLCWWAGSISSLLGWALGLVSLWTLLAKPVFELCRWAWQATLAQSGVQHGLKVKALQRLVICLGLCALLLLAPWPDRTLVQGVIWASENALIRSEVEGLITTLHVRDGQQVQSGDLLATLHNPQLAARREHISAKLNQAEQGQYAHLGTDSAKAGQAGDEVGQLAAELARIDEQIAQLQIRARQSGKLVWPNTDDLQGRYAHRGQLLGQILNPSPPVVKVAVAQADVAPLQAHTRAVSVRLRESGSTAMPATLVRDAVGATEQLPSPALSLAMGGDIVTDPKDERHLKATRPVVLMDVVLNQPMPVDHPARLGQRAWVRLDQGWSPPIWQLWRWVRHRALSDFNPSR